MVVALLLTVVGAIALSSDLRLLERAALLELDELGALAPPALILLYVVAAVFLLPVFPLDMAAGAHFGFWAGVLWVQVAATVGALVGHRLGHGLLRKLFDRLLARRPGLREGVLAAVEREGPRIVFLTRLSPIFSYGLLNGLYGAARLGLGRYLVATFVGVLPGTALYVYAGVVAADLASDSTGTEPARSGFHWTVEIAGFLVTLVVVFLVTRSAQRALSRSLQDPGAETTGTRPDSTPT